MAYFSLRWVVPHARAGTTAHRIEHVIAFGLLGLLVLPLSRNRAEEWGVVLILLGLGAALELGQHTFFRNVPFEWWDARDDAIGVLVAWLLVRSARRKLV